ncbi:MAG: AMP-binding protein [Pseudomonadota bacterium]
MRLSERVYDTFVSHAKNPLFEFFSSSYPITRSDEVRPTFNEDLENAIKAELAHYPSLGSKIVTYAQVYPWVMHLGNRLELATQAGDLIGLSLQDHAFWYTAEFSIIGSQRGAVGSYSGWSAQDIFDTWALSNVSLVIIDQMVLDKLIKSQLKWPDTVKKIILMSDAAVDLSPYAVLLSKIKLESIVIDYFSSPQVDLRTGRNQFREEMFSNQFDENNTALVIFTSGTSGGKPKGIAYSHKRWSEGKPNFRNMDPMISVHEPSWSTGKHTMWTSFLSGGKISFIPKQSHLFEINRLVHPERAVFVPFQARELYSMYLDFFEKEQNRLARYSNKCSFTR